MTKLAEIILTLALSLPRAATDAHEPLEARTERLTTIAVAIDAASARATCAEQPEECSPIWRGSSDELAVLLLSLAWWESRLARNVHAGQCRPFECDAATIRGRVVHRARSLWQLQATGLVPAAEWRLLAGIDLEPTSRAAWAATRVLAASRGRCRGSLEGAVAQYGTGRRCDWPGAKPRMRTHLHLLAKASDLRRAAETE